MTGWLHGPGSIDFNSDGTDVRQEQVDRLDIAMDQVAFVSVLQAERDLVEVLAGFLDRQRTGQADIFAQVGSLDVFHGEIKGIAGLIHVAKLDDVGMIEPGHRFHFLEETLLAFVAGQGFAHE